MNPQVANLTDSEFCHCHSYDVHTDGLQIPAIRAELVTVAHVSTTTAEWLLEISGLTVGPREGGAMDIVAHGQALAAQVRAAASAHLAVTQCVDVTCGDKCPLAGVDGGTAACRLAVMLAGAGTVSTSPTMDRDRTAMLFLQAIRAASSAVFHCRRHAHPTGECWFSDNGSDVCGDVLAVAHRVGA